MIKTPKIREVEFIAVLALLMSISAYSIDAMLPALGIIGTDFNVQVANQTQFIISALFVGLSIGQLFYGPLSDSVGRRTSIFLGLAIFILGSVISSVSTNMSVMLMGRVLQGFGASGPRIVAMALVRDRFKGEAMARIMSFVMAVFIIVPALAPAVGQWILNIFNWRSIFVSQLVLGMIALFWFGFRLQETLPKANRKRFDLPQFYSAFQKTIRQRSTVGYTLASGFILAAFMGYLNSAQQVYQGYFALGDKLPLFFGILSVAIGSASFTNSQLVMRLGMSRLVWLAAGISSLASTSFVLVMALQPQWVSLTSFMAAMIVIFFCAGILFGNLSSLALEPLGDIAGSASAFIGTFQSVVSVSFGVLIGQMYNGTLYPLMLGYSIMGVCALAALTITGSFPFTKKLRD